MLNLISIYFDLIKMIGYTQMYMTDTYCHFCTTNNFFLYKFPENYLSLVGQTLFHVYEGHI